MSESDTFLQLYLGILPESDENAVLRLLIELGAQFVGAEEGSLLLLDPKARDLVFVMTVGSLEAEKTLIGQRVPLGSGLTGLAALTREVQIGAPVFHGVRQAQDAQGQAKEPQAVLAAPMLISDRVVGVLTAVSFDRSKAFHAGDALLFGRIATVAGVLVEQRQKLNAVLQVQDPSRDPSHALELQVVDAVRRLVGRDPDNLVRVAGILDHILGLMGQGGDR